MQFVFPFNISHKKWKCLGIFKMSLFEDWKFPTEIMGLIYAIASMLCEKSEATLEVPLETIGTTQWWLIYYLEQARSRPTNNTNITELSILSTTHIHTWWNNYYIKKMNWKSEKNAIKQDFPNNFLSGQKPEILSSLRKIWLKCDMHHTKLNMIVPVSIQPWAKPLPPFVAVTK